MIRHGDLSPLFDLVRTRLRSTKIDVIYRGVSKARRKVVARSRLMRPDLLAPLSPVFTGLGLEGRLFLHGARTKTNKHGRTVVRPLPEALQAHKALMKEFHDFFSDLPSIDE